MPRLLIMSAGGAAQVIELQHGVNRMGRRDTNDIQINDPSISGEHCELVCGQSSITVRDLGSTNGTFIDGQPIHQAELQPGRALRLGSVEMMLEPPPVHIAIPNMSSPPPVAVPQFTADGARCCVNHPTARATLECTKCDAVYCEACPRDLRRIGGQAMKFCPACNGQCVPLGTRASGAARERRSFASHFLSAFHYPFKRDGLVLLAAGTIFYVVLNFLARFSILISIILSGYMFAFMQKIIQSSAQGDEDLPSWPEVANFWEDILQPALLWGATLIISFGPALAVLIWALANTPGAILLLIPLVAWGVFYFPMALLAAAMHDSFAALNPIFVLPSILRVPAAYMAVCLFLAGIVAIEIVAQLIVNIIPIPFVPTILTGFVTLYFMTVEMRILGLLYFVNRDRLRWF